LDGDVTVIVTNWGEFTKGEVGVLTVQVPEKLDVAAFQYCTEVTFADQLVGRLKVTGSKAGGLGQSSKAEFGWFWI
jgi:hypothetical protein